MIVLSRCARFGAGHGYVQSRIATFLRAVLCITNCHFAAGSSHGLGTRQLQADGHKVAAFSRLAGRARQDWNHNGILARAWGGCLPWRFHLPF
jgi:hypothetical protein